MTLAPEFVADCRGAIRIDGIAQIDGEAGIVSRSVGRIPFSLRLLLDMLLLTVAGFGPPR